MVKSARLACIILSCLSLAATQDKTVVQRAESNEMEYRFEFGEGVPAMYKVGYALWSKTGLANIIKREYNDWRELRLTNIYEPGNLTVVLKNKKTVVGYLDKTHPEKWQIIQPDGSKPVEFNAEAFGKIYGAFEFFNDKNRKPGDEFFTTFENRLDKHTPYRAIIIKVTAIKILDLKHEKGVTTLEFFGAYYESAKPLDRETIKFLPRDWPFHGYLGAPDGKYRNLILKITLGVKFGDKLGLIHVKSKEWLENRDSAKWNSNDQQLWNAEPF